MPDLLFQQLSAVQSDKSPVPLTLPSAGVVAPLTKLTFITGTASIGTIVPPVSGYHELAFIFTNAVPAAFLTSGNIKRSVTPVQNIPVVLMYDPVSALYWPDNGS